MGLFEFLGSFTHINTQYGGFAWYYGWEKEKRVFNLDDFGRENILLKDFEEAIGSSNYANFNLTLQNINTMCLD